MSWFFLFCVTPAVALAAFVRWRHRLEMQDWRERTSKPHVCEWQGCDRSFPHINEEALPAGKEGLAGEGLLVLHIRHQHQGHTGPLLGVLPPRVQVSGVVLRPPPEIWHRSRNWEVKRVSSDG